MADTVKLHVVKGVINRLIPLLNAVVPERPATHPQTLILQRVFQRLENTYTLEELQQRRGLDDNNFHQVLQTMVKVLTYIMEEDRYYRQWLALAFLLVAEELDTMKDEVSRDAFVRSIREQWGLRWHMISNDHYEAYRDQLYPVLLTDFLYKLATYASPN